MAKPASATPPANGHHVPALQPDKNDVLFIWVMVKGEGYRVSRVQTEQPAGGAAWALQKHSDGTTYHLYERRDPGSAAAVLYCDCPGAVAHGPHCCGNKGCKHARMVTALRRLFVSGKSAATSAKGGVS